MSEVGCYLTHLYCDAHACKRQAEYTGPTESSCRSQARKHGWFIRQRQVYCHGCNKHRLKVKRRAVGLASFSGRLTLGAK